MPLFNVISSIHKKKRNACTSCRPLDVHEAITRFNEAYLDNYSTEDIKAIFGNRIPDLGKIIMSFYRTNWKESGRNLLTMLRLACLNDNNCMDGRKNLVLSENYRAKGNEAFKKNCFIKAQDWYTMCLLFAPKDSEVLTLALGNRSAAYMRRGFYEHAVEDCDLALQAGHKHVGKLLYRKAEALIKMGRLEEADQVMTCIEAKDRDEEKKRELMAQKQKIKTNEPAQYPHLVGPIRKREAELSNKVEVVRNETKGLHIVATKKIYPGEMILDESAYATTLITFSFDHRHCHHCKRLIMADHVFRDAYSRHVNPHPCRECSNVFYCCQECRDNSWHQYHRFECRYLDLIYFPSEHPHLALRALVTTNLRTLYETIKAAKTNQHNLPKAGDWQSHEIDPDFGHLFTLDLHWNDYSQVERVSLFRQTLLLSIFLIESGYIDQKLEEAFGVDWKKAIDRDEWIEFIIGILYRLNLQARTHAQPMKRILESIIMFNKTRVWKYETSLFASGLFPIYLRNFNHSCQPNTHHYIEQCNRIVLRASRIIQPGEEITHVYLDAHYSYYNVNKRRQLLKHNVLFECNCSRCSMELAFWKALDVQDINNEIDFNENFYFDASHCSNDSKIMVQTKDSTTKGTFQCCKCSKSIESKTILDIFVHLCSVLSDTRNPNKIDYVAEETDKLVKKLNETTCAPMRSLLTCCSAKDERLMLEQSIVSQSMLDYVTRMVQIDIGIFGKLSTPALMSTVLWFNLQWEFEAQKADAESMVQLLKLKKFGQELMEIFDSLSPANEDEMTNYWGYFWLLKQNVGERLHNFK